jgi:hypothetical protein
VDAASAVVLHRVPYIRCITYAFRGRCSVGTEESGVSIVPKFRGHDI